MKPYITKINSARIFGLLFAITLSLAGGTAQAQGNQVWYNQDIGTVGLAGTSSYVSGTLTVKGAGNGIGGVSDSCHFVYVPMTGNAEIIVQVSSVSGSTGIETGGIMFRETLDPAATNAMISTSSSNGVGVNFESRLTAGSTSETVFGPGYTAPVWLRLVRSGSTFAGYESTDGFNWNPTGTSTIAMANSYYAGFAVSSGDVALLSTGVFSNVSVLTNVPQPSANMLLWLRADADIVVNYDFFPDMYEWYDQSGNYNDAFSIYVDNDPQLIADSINGLNAVTFNGTSAYLQFDYAGYLDSLSTGFSDFTQGLSIIAVANPATIAFNASMVDLSTAYLQNEIILGRSGTTSNFQLEITSGTTTSTVISTGSSLALNKYQLLEAIQTGNSGVNANAVTLFQNGKLVGSGTNSAIPNINRTNSYLGANSNLTELYAGALAEVFIFNRNLTDSERQDMEAYIFQKYGVGTQPVVAPPTSSVPTGVYPTPQTVTLSSSGSAIYYTTDGSIPTTASTLYTGPFLVSNASTTINAIAVNFGYANSVPTKIVIKIEPSVAGLPFGLTMWLRPNSLSGTNGSPIAQWIDSSGNGNNAVQTAPGNRPTYLSNGINGFPVVHFTGSLSQFFKLPDMLSTAASAQILIVLRETNTTSANGLWEFGTNSGGDYYTYNNGEIYDGFGASVRKAAGAPGVDVTNFSVYEASSATKQWEDWINGTPLLTTTANIVAFSKTPLLGRNAQNAYFTGDVAEVMLYDRTLSSADRQVLEAYIYNIYGVGTQPPTPAPTISAPTGIYSGLQSVTLSDSGSGAIIYYTTDGTTPTTSSTIYTAPIPVLTSATIQAIAQQPTYAPSVIVSSTITIDADTANVAQDGLTMWLRADSLSGSNGSPVALWPDESGNGNNAIQTGLGNQPTYQSNVLDGNPVVRFTGFLTQYFTLPNMLSTAASGQILIVLNEPNTTSTNGLWLFGTNSGGDYYTYSNGGIFDGFGASVRKSAGSPGVDVTKFNVYEASSAAKLWEDWINGTPLLTTTANVVAFSKTPLLGRNAQNAYFTGNIAEVLLYNRTLSTTERQNLEAYIYQRYGAGTQPVTPVPTISVPTGLYSGPQSVTLSDSVGAIIYYTTDGSTPTTSSTIYTSPITVTTSSTISAIAQLPMYAPSVVASSTITFDATADNVSRDGLTMWLRSDSLSGTNGSPVAVWPDVSGNGNNATQTALSNQPTYHSNALNGLPVVQFTGFLSQYFNLPNMLSKATAGQILIVLNEPSTTSTNGLWLFGTNSGGDYYTNANGEIYDGFGANVRKSAGLPGVDVTQFNVYEASSAAQLWEDWIDGTPLLTTTANVVAFSKTPLLGRNAQSAYFTGNVAEVLVYNRALSTAERQNLEVYIYQRYGVGNLPITPVPSIGITNALYSGAQSVTLSDSTGAIIYYTTDGSTPTTNSTIYSTPVTVLTTSTLQAIAQEPGFASSAVVSATITIDTTTANVARDGLTMWLRSDSLSETNGTPVALWPDYSGNGNNATQTGLGNQPTYQSSLLNGLPAVHFNGSSSQYFTLPNMLSNATAGQILIVLREPNITSANGLWVFGGNSTGDYYTYTNGYIYDDFGSKTRQSVGAPGVDVTQFNVYEASSAASLWQGWIDGTPLLSTTANTVSFIATPRLGRNAQNKCFTGDVVEVLLYNRTLSTAERQDLEIYINQRYGVGNLPPTPAPAISVPSGLYSGAQSVTLSASTGAVIYYTTDGSTPTTSSTTYAAPFPVSTSSTIQAIAQEPGFPASAVVSSTITIDLATANVARDGLTMWLRADSISGTNGSPVALWPDSSGNGNNATQSAASFQPSYQPNVLNGMPVVQFLGGSSQYFTLPNMLSTAASGQILIVLKEPSKTTLNGLWVFGTNSTGDYYTSSNGGIYDDFGSSVRQPVGLPGVDPTQFNVYEASSAPSLWQAWIDGLALYTTSTNTVSFIATPRLGKNAQNHYFTGEVAEVLLYNRSLSTDERQALETYISQRYGVGTP